MKVEVAVLGSPSLTVRKKKLWSLWTKSNIQLGPTELRSCVKVEVAVLGPPYLTVRKKTRSNYGDHSNIVDVKQH